MPCQYGWAAIPMKTSTPFLLIHAHSNFLNLMPKTLTPHQQSLHPSPETMIKLNPSHTPSLSSPFPLKFPTHTFLSLTPISNFNFPRLSLLRPRQKPKSKDVELLVETCITRTLPPALTLEHGLQMIKDAVDELKSNPPRFNSGMYRFQVAVPPSAKALNWCCCQPESSGVFPQFFLSKEKDNPTFRSFSLSGVRGVFGIGTAVLFKGSSSCASSEWSSIKRYLSVDSTLVRAYGVMDVDFGRVIFHEAHKRLILPFLYLRPLWEDLRHCKVPLLLVVGEKDDEFRRIAKEMFHDRSARSIDDREEICEIVEVPSSGHVVHLENPLPLINAIRRFLKKSKRV